MVDKTLRRFLVDALDPGACRCIIGGSEARHIQRVLRMRPGDRLVLVDGVGNRWLGRIAGFDRQEVRIDIETSLERPLRPRLEITLCQAVLKSQRMDLVIQKSTELGVSRIMPFFSERAVVAFKGGGMENKVRRWAEIARMAVAQSDGDRLPKIEAPVSYRGLLEQLGEEEAAKAVFWEKEKGQDLKDFLHEQRHQARFFGVVGPEGGFTAEEIAMASEAGCASLSMGRRILRAETAAIVLIGILQYEWGDLGREGDSSGDGRSSGAWC